MLVIEEASPADAEDIVAVTRAAFAEVAEEYEDPDMPPLRETPDDVRAHLSDHVVLKAVEDGRLVGTVRGVLHGATCEIGRLAVDPARQGRGIATALLRDLEERFADAERFELFTGHHDGAAMRLYERLGYTRHAERRISARLTLVYLEKTR